MMKARRGFSMLIAIFVILILSLVASYIFYASSSVSKEGSIQYQREQAAVLARSYTEYAVLAVSGNDRDKSTKCINEINADIGTPDTGRGYRVRVDITYIGNSRYINNNIKCKNIAAELDNTDTDTLSVIVDVYVKYKDIQNPSLYNGNAKLVPWQAYHKRSIQKI